MAKWMLDRSTWWVNSGGANPVTTGDYRHYWSIYYETDETNRQTKFTVYYYVQYHFTKYEEGAQMDYLYEVPSGTSTVYINDESIGSIDTPKLEIEKGASWTTKYVDVETFTIAHKADGSASFDFKGSGFGKWTSNSTYSTAKGFFPAIPSQSILGTIDTFNIDEGIASIDIKTQSNNHYHKLEISNGSNIFKTINGFANGDAVAFTEAELNDIYTKIPTGTKAKFTFTLTTYSDSNMTTTLGTDTKVVEGNFTILLPTVKGAVCTDNNDTTLRLTGDSTNQTIIKNISQIVVTIPSTMHAVANTRCATITEYVIEDKHVTYATNGVSVNLWKDDENGAVDQEEANIYNSKDYVTVYAVDSRGTSSLPYVKKFTKYINYEHAMFNLKNGTIGRSDNGVGRFITANFTGTWWDGDFGARENELWFNVYYLDASEGYWTDMSDFMKHATLGSIDETLVDTSTPGVFKYNGPINSIEDDKGFDINTSYDILLLASDVMKNHVWATTIEFGKPAMAVYKNKAALGGPYDETLGGTQLWDSTYLNGEILNTYKPNVMSAWYETGVSGQDRYTDTFEKWVAKQILINTENTIGDKLTLSNNAIVIGAGVSKIKMQGAIFYGEATPNGQLRGWCQVIDGTTSELKASIPAYAYKDSTSDIVLTIPMMLVDVSEGDKVVLNGQIGPTSGTVEIRQKGTTLYVEVVK